MAKQTSRQTQQQSHTASGSLSLHPSSTTQPSPRPVTCRCAFSWQNFAIIGVAVTFIVAGFLLMLPEADVRNTVGGRFAAAPGPGAFDARRIRAAPIPCFIGFALMVPAILYVPPRRR